MFQWEQRKIWKEKQQLVNIGYVMLWDGFEANGSKGVK